MQAIYKVHIIRQYFLQLLPPLYLWNFSEFEGLREVVLSLKNQQVKITVTQNCINESKISMIFG